MLDIKSFMYIVYNFIIFFINWIIIKTIEQCAGKNLRFIFFVRGFNFVVFAFLFYLSIWHLFEL